MQHLEAVLIPYNIITSKKLTVLHDAPLQSTALLFFQMTSTSLRQTMTFFCSRLFHCLSEKSLLLQ